MKIKILSIGMAVACALNGLPASANTYVYRTAVPGLVASPGNTTSASQPSMTTPAVFDKTNYGCLYPSYSTDSLSYTCPWTSSGGYLYTNSYLTAPKSSGKWYWEVKLTTATWAAIGVDGHYSSGAYPGGGSVGYGYYSTGALYHSGSSQLAAATYTAGDVISVMLDLDGKTVSFSKNCGSAYVNPTSISAGTYYGEVSGYYNQTTTFVLNAGQSAFKCSMPAGYSALGQ